MDATLATDINAISRIHGTFRLRSGAMASEYFDKYRFESDPKLLARIADAMIPLIPPGTEVLAGMELGGVPIATAMSLRCGLPAVFVRKVAKEYGTCQAVEGRDVSGRNVAIIEDVITTGGAVIDGGRILRDLGATLTGIVCVIWRAHTEPHLAPLSLAVTPLFTKANLD